MFLKNFTLPFKIDDIYEGLAESEGLLCFEADSLKLEFSTKDSIFGVIKSKVKNVYIPLDKIKIIEHKKGFFNDKVFIFCNSMKIVERIPGSEGNEVKMMIKKKYRQDAQVFASKINLLIAENRLNDLEHETF